MTHASAQELKAYLANGLGRAHVVLDAPDSRLRETLVASCLKDEALPLEDPRAPYLFELVQHAGAKEDLAAALADPLADSPGDDDLEQRYELVGLLARDGVPGMRDVLYRGQEQIVDRWLAEPGDLGPSTVPGRHLIALDGIRGAAFAFAQLGRAAPNGSFWADDELIDALREALLDDGQADRWLAGARTNDASGGRARCV